MLSCYVSFVHTSFGGRSFSVAVLSPAIRICTSPEAVHRQLKIHYWQQAFLRTESLSACASESANRPLCETARL